VAVKNLSLAEEYLADHFPAYPVLPGVMMLEATIQAAAWLVRATSDFDRTLIILKEASAVRYGSFVRPGGQLAMDVQAVEIGPDSSRFKVVGSSDGQQCIQAKITLEHLNIADKDAGRAEFDAWLRQFWRERFALVGGPQALAASAKV
jgi:3-hydroxyacyl-[acyl-carrier-protein] dehydratase